MSNCENVKEWLGPYLDGEVAPAVREEIETHLSRCRACMEECEELRAVAAAVAEPLVVGVPPSLWEAIENRLVHPRTVRYPFSNVVRSRPVLLLAASVAIVVGLGLFTLPWVRDGGSRVQAATVDFGALLDSLQGDVRAAFDRFLAKYDAKEAALTEAKRVAPGLSFDLPGVLPGGFELQAMYVLRFGDAPGVAARYGRSGEFLGVVFHPPVLREHFGTHKDHSCVVGKHRGHKVPVSEWALVHLTDPTTCHCVLSRLDEATELPAVMAALVPAIANVPGHDDLHHDHRP